MGTRIYMALLAVVLAVGILKGTYHLIPLWLVWLLGLALAVFVALVGFVIFGRRVQRGDFDPARRPGQE